MQEDKVVVMEIGRELGINLEENKIKSVVRLGKKANNGNVRPRPRLVKVVLDSESTAKEVFRAASRVAESEVGLDKAKDIKVFRDMTKIDRDRRKKLVEEMLRRNKELQDQNVTNAKWIIRGEQLVRIRINPEETSRPRPQNPKNY